MLCKSRWTKASAKHLNHNHLFTLSDEEDDTDRQTDRQTDRERGEKGQRMKEWNYLCRERMHLYTHPCEPRGSLVFHALCSLSLSVLYLLHTRYTIPHIAVIARH